MKLYFWPHWTKTKALCTPWDDYRLQKDENNFSMCTPELFMVNIVVFEYDLNKILILEIQ